MASGGATQSNSNKFSCTSFANLTTVELILVPLAIPVDFRPPNGWEVEREITDIGAGNNTTVVVTEDNDRAVVQRRVEYPLAGYKEVITITESVHGYFLFS